MTNGQNSGAGGSTNEPGRSASETQSSPQRNTPASAGVAKSSASTSGGGAKSNPVSGSVAGSAKSTSSGGGGSGSSASTSTGGSGNIGAKASDAIAKASEVAQTAGEQGRQAAASIVSDAGEKAKHLFNEQVGAGADLAQQFAGSVRMAANNLAGSSPLLANFARLAADKVDEFSDTVRGQTAEQFLSTASDYARRRPAVVFTAAAACGFVLFRLLKAAPSATIHQASRHRSDESPLQPREDEWEHTGHAQAFARRGTSETGTSQVSGSGERGRQGQQGQHFHGV